MRTRGVKSSKVLKVFFVTMIFMIIFTSFGYADPIDGIFKVLKNYYPNSQQIVKEITEYDSSNYYLDIKKYGSFFDVMKNLAANTNQINNFLFSVNKGITKITIFILLFAYKVNIFSMLAGYLDIIIDALKVPIYDQTLYVVIAGIGIYAIAVSVFANRKTTVMDETIKTIVIVTLALIFMSNPSKYLTDMNDFSIDVSDELFESTYGRYKNISQSDEALISAGKMIWDSMAHKPWQILVLGGTDDDYNTKRLLKLSPYDEAREEIVTSLSETNYLLRLEGIPGRFFTLLLITALNIAICLIIIALSAFSVSAQVMVVIFGIAAPFVFLVALIPRFSNILGSWGAKILGYSMIKIIISIALSVLLIMVAVIYSSVDEYGILATLIVLVIVTVTIYSSRKQIINMIKSIPRGAKNVQREARRTPGTKEKVKEYKDIAGGYTKGGLSRAKASSPTKDATTSRKTYLNAKMSKDTSTAKATSDYSQGATTNTDNYTKEKYDEYRSIAKKKLESDYKAEKEKANHKASLLGTTPKYSRFVTDADTRFKLGEEMFTEGQINEEIKNIRRLDMLGQNPEMYAKGKINITNKDEAIEVKIKVKEIEKGPIDRRKSEAAGDGDTTKSSTSLSNQVDRLEHRNEELLDELKHIGNDGKTSKNQGFDNEQIEKLGEEISKSTNSKENEANRDIATVRNINQHITVNDAKGLDGQFESTYGIKNNEIFFENLINKYGAENVQKELEGMKTQDNIKNPKGLLITRLKNNNERQE